jgi:hypothetical protein
MNRRIPESRATHRNLCIRCSAIHQSPSTASQVEVGTPGEGIAAVRDGTGEFVPRNEAHGPDWVAPGIYRTMAFQGRRNHETDSLGRLSYNEFREAVPPIGPKSLNNRSGASVELRQPAIKLVGKRLLVSGAVGSRTPGLHARAPEFVHQVS